MLESVSWCDEVMNAKTKHFVAREYSAADTPQQMPPDVTGLISQNAEMGPRGCGPRSGRAASIARFDELRSRSAFASDSSHEMSRRNAVG
jgi:hypothetical protein